MLLIEFKFFVNDTDLQEVAARSGVILLEIKSPLEAGNEKSIYLQGSNNKPCSC
jgi:hypothetical protein